MFRKPLTTLGHSRAGLGSTLALALALAGGAVIATAALSSPALAQRQQQQQQQQQAPTLTRNFQPLYQAVADATNTTGDYAAAKTQVPALIAAIGSEYDRFFAGNILLQLGAKASDKALQRQGLELMLASGQATPADTGLFRYFLGGFAYDAQDYEGARRELQAAIAGGFQGNFADEQDPWGLIAESYFKQGRYQEGIAGMKSAFQQRSAAGQSVREVWLLRSLAIAYEQRLPEEAVDVSTLLIETSPTEVNWLQTLQVVNALTTVDAQAQLDMLRLMALTNTLRERGDFARYIETADPRIMSNEVARVLDKAVQAGVLTTGDDYYVEVKRVVDERAPVDRREAPAMAAEARSAAGTGRNALNAGDVYLSLGSYAEAEEMFALGLQKGGADRDRLLTRLGIAQVHQGKYAEAKATFAQVSGERASVARMWTLYVDSRA